MLYFPINNRGIIYYIAIIIENFIYLNINVFTNCKIAATIFHVVLMSIAENPSVLQALKVA